MTALRLTVADAALAAAVRNAPWDEVGIRFVGPDDPADAWLVVGDGEPPVAADVPVLLAGAGKEQLAGAGLAVQGVMPPHEIRVRSAAGLDPWATDDLLLEAALPMLQAAEGLELLATADLSLRTQPVLTWDAARRVGALAFGASADDWAGPVLPTLVSRWIRHVGGFSPTEAIGVGLLGYGAIGHQHNRAIQAVPGLRLAAVCDLSPARIAEAQALAPGARAHRTGEELLGDPDVDLIVVSTPPASHHQWAMAALEAGKHVVLEKPMALTAAECDQVLAAAAAADRRVAVYQNRRWDPDFLVLQRLVDNGRIGELFHLEAFVGGYGHPCNYWHSDAAVSGGAIFDWGSHFLDQVLLLMGSDIATVTARNHKRRWLDVSNADHSRVTLAFGDGREATFIHSDLAAALKPKWYLLGTTGAIVGEYVTERFVRPTEIGTVEEHRFAPADAPARLSLHTDEGVTELRLPDPPSHPFHTELARHLHTGAPMSVRPEQSRTVVAVMAAAEASAAADGAPVAL